MNFFFREMYGDKVNNTCHTLMKKPSLPAEEILCERHNIVFPTCTKTAPKLFVHEIMGNKMNVMVGQRISQSGKGRS